MESLQQPKPQLVTTAGIYDNDHTPLFASEQESDSRSVATPRESDDESPQSVHAETLGMLELEACLGFHFRNGLSKTKGVRDSPVIAELLNGIHQVAVRFKGYRRQRLSNSMSVKKASDNLFCCLGSKLWPSVDQPCPHWLFDASRDGQVATSHLRQYLPDRLHFAIPDKRN